MRLRLTGLSTLLLALIASITPISHAQDSVIAGDPRFPRVTEPSWVNYQFLDKQRETVTNLSQIHYGKRIRSDKTDLGTLQKIVNDALIEKKDTKSLQALGVVMGDIYLRQHDDLVWVVYEDELGKSFAVCIANTTHCLFPLTMLSRRIEVGATPDVSVIYETGWQSIKRLLPRKPFQRD